MAATLETPRPSKGFKGLGMDGALARWYARNTGKSLDQFRVEARDLAAPLASGASILEVAPGPGYLAIELAKLGRFRVVGLDISKTCVEIARENARKAAVEIAFHHGNAAEMPFDANSFDFLVCRAAFKNFSEPVRSLTEMHRVLKSGGRALIIDLRKDASPRDIAAAVDGMKLSRLNALLTRLVFKHMLLGRAHSKESFQKMAAQTPFETCSFREELISLEVHLFKT
jgi:ubiquinone/menaquinone biosynthesis C-methylase UbiE